MKTPLYEPAVCVIIGTMITLQRSALLLVVLFIGIISFTGLAKADHAWGEYHWARTSNPFTLQLGDNVSGTWDSYLQTASSDWSLSDVLDTTITAGLAGKNCRATAGRAEICAKKYGYNGWLGIAQIWVSGDHITQGVVKMNDTYFNTSKYNSSAWRNLVMCQEIGHIFGLDHQDENFNNAPLGTCMDYSNDPNPNQHPNQHDYDMLEEIYAHLDSSTTIKESVVSNPPQDRRMDANDDPSTWGREIRRSADGRASLFALEHGDGTITYTHVFWAEGEIDGSQRSDIRQDSERSR